MEISTVEEIQEKRKLTTSFSSSRRIFLIAVSDDINLPLVKLNLKYRVFSIAMPMLFSVKGQQTSKKSFANFQNQEVFAQNFFRVTMNAIEPLTIVCDIAMNLCVL
jgi:hypothetical protein